MVHFSLVYATPCAPKSKWHVPPPAYGFAYGSYSQLCQSICPPNGSKPVPSCLRLGVLFLPLVGLPLLFVLFVGLFGFTPFYFSFLFLSFVFFSSFNVSGLLACIWCPRRIQDDDGMSLQCLLPLRVQSTAVRCNISVVILWPHRRLYLSLTRMNQHWHRVCWMSTGRKSGRWRTHTPNAPSVPCNYCWMPTWLFKALAEFWNMGQKLPICYYHVECQTGCWMHRTI